MKATFALLPDLQTQNAITVLSWDLHRRHGTGIDVRKLPPHVSLKQPFDAPDLGDLTLYMQEFAVSIAPFEVSINGPQIWPWPSAEDARSGVLTARIREIPLLRGLHSLLNSELAERFGERPAAFDGETYSFHLTISAGGPSLERYRDLSAEAGKCLPPLCRLESLAMFVYDRPSEADEWSYSTYRIVPLVSS